MQRFKSLCIVFSQERKMFAVLMKFITLFAKITTNNKLNKHIKNNPQKDIVGYFNHHLKRICF